MAWRRKRKKKSRRTVSELAVAIWRDRLTASGRYLLLGLLLAVFLSWSSLHVPDYHLACALIALACVAVAAGFLLRPRLEVRGRFPARAIAGRPVTGAYVLTNRSRRTAYDLAVGFFNLPPALRAPLSEETIPQIRPGESATAPLELRPRKRGHYPLPPLRAFTTFPFHLWRTPSRLQAPPDALLVLPDFQPLEEIDVPVNTRHQPGGIALTSHIGESPEYIGNRDYRHGDSLRRIDFRSWARLARPIVREFQEEYYCRIALVLDTFIPARRRERPGGFPELEAAVSLSAAVADALSRGEYIIDVFAAGPELYVFRAGRHLTHFDNVLEILACVDACRHNPFETITPALADELANISTVICVFLDWDRAREELVRAAVESGCRTKVIIVRDGPTTLPEDDARAIADSVTRLTPAAIQQGAVEEL